jgi:hypothetical protein
MASRLTARHSFLDVNGGCGPDNVLVFVDLFSPAGWPYPPLR